MRVITATELDTLSEEARQAPRGRRNLNLHSRDDSQAHRLYNAVEPGSYIRPHRHLDPEKDETFLLVRGRLAVLSFSDEGEVLSLVTLSPGDAADIPSGTWHSAVALETGTIFFEAKSGPYLPLSPEEIALWAPQENTPEAVIYLSGLTHLVMEDDESSSH